MRLVNKGGHPPGPAHPQYKHGMHGTHLYRVWRGMKARCLNPNDPMYAYYGGRGITIVPEWLDFAGFLAWAASTEIESNTLDRIDNDKGYSPDNCRWATAEEQQNNTRKNVRVVYRNIEMSLSQAARASGIKIATLWRRKNAGWPDHRLFESPRK